MIRNLRSFLLGLALFLAAVLGASEAAAALPDLALPAPVQGLVKPVPDVSGQPVTTATSTLNGAGFENLLYYGKHSASIPLWHAIGTIPKGGMNASTEDDVVVVVSVPPDWPEGEITVGTGAAPMTLLAVTILIAGVLITISVLAGASMIRNSIAQRDSDGGSRKQ